MTGYSPLRWIDSIRASFPAIHSSAVIPVSCRACDSNSTAIATPWA